MEPLRCPVFVDGRECDLPLTPVDLEAEKIARDDLVIYECGLGHRTHFVLEPKSKARPSDTTREEIRQRMGKLAREFVETHDPEIREEIYRLARLLVELDH
jgi:hypothetical protein